MPHHSFSLESNPGDLSSVRHREMGGSGRGGEDAVDNAIEIDFNHLANEYTVVTSSRTRGEEDYVISSVVVIDTVDSNGGDLSQPSDEKPRKSRGASGGGGNGVVGGGSKGGSGGHSGGGGGGSSSRRSRDESSVTTARSRSDIRPQSPPQSRTRTGALSRDRSMDTLGSTRRSFGDGDSRDDSRQPQMSSPQSRTAFDPRERFLRGLSSPTNISLSSGSSSRRSGARRHENDSGNSADDEIDDMIIGTNRRPRSFRTAFPRSGSSISRGGSSVSLSRSSSKLMRPSFQRGMSSSSSTMSSSSSITSVTGMNVSSGDPNAKNGTSPLVHTRSNQSKSGVLSRLLPNRRGGVGESLRNRFGGSSSAFAMMEVVVESRDDWSDSSSINSDSES